MRKRTFIDALPPFWNIFGNWKSLGTNYRRIPDVCLVKKWWLKRGWDSKRLWKFKLSLYSSHQISVAVSDVFEYFVSKNSTYLGSILFAPHLTRQRKFSAAFFPNCGNPARPRSRINPALDEDISLIKRANLRVNFFKALKRWLLVYLLFKACYMTRYFPIAETTIDRPAY